MKLTNYLITDSVKFEWDCYGNKARIMNYLNDDQNGYETSIIFEANSEKVFEIEVCDYKNNRAYRIINPDYINEHSEEVAKRDPTGSINIDEAWENVPFIDLDVDEDFIEKFHAISNGESYDDRVTVSLDFRHDQLFSLMKLAHEQDITLNELINNTLKNFVENHESLTEDYGDTAF